MRVNVLLKLLINFWINYIIFLYDKYIDKKMKKNNKIINNCKIGYFSKMLFN